jgi:hypothetical protein
MNFSRSFLIFPDNTYNFVNITHLYLCCNYSQLLFESVHCTKKNAKINRKFLSNCFSIHFVVRLFNLTILPGLGLN